MCICDTIKIALLPMRSVFINVKKGISDFCCWLAAKHTTNIVLLFALISRIAALSVF